MTTLTDTDALDLARRIVAAQGEPTPTSPMGLFLATGEITETHLEMAREVEHLSGERIAPGEFGIWPVREFDDYILATGMRGPVLGWGQL